ncbi:hypothetical protein Q5752_006978 [Cryptotrichosporon argae]
MPIPARSSFTPLATLDLAAPAVLHPAACNPAMDLVVLLSPDAGGGGGGWAGRLGVALWRMSGSAVWSAEVEGELRGLAWSRDGLHLALLLVGKETSVTHLSVHTGELVRVVPVGAPAGPVRIEWVDAGLSWTDPGPGSARVIIDSLPAVTPVDPPKPAITNPFLPPPPSKPTSLAHPLLSTFPALLPAPTPVAPHVLSVPPLRLLTGTFPVPPAPDAAVLALAQVSDTLCGLFEGVIRGIEAMEAAVKDGEKQTMLWREEVETCGEQQGMTRVEVHADLFRLLMTGRTGPAVTDWLGNRMSNRVVAKWEALLLAAYTTVVKVISESVAPALERVVLLLDELGVWSDRSAKLSLDTRATRAAMRVARGLLGLVERVRREAIDELKAATQFFEWLKFEIARGSSAADGPDAAPLPAYDLKLAWAFLVSAFAAPALGRHFPHPPAPHGEHLDPRTYAEPFAPAQRTLHALLRDTERRLAKRHTHAQAHGHGDAERDVSVDTGVSYDSRMDSHVDDDKENIGAVDEGSLGTPSHGDDDNGDHGNDYNDDDDDDDDGDDDGSQPDTVRTPGPQVERRVEDEPRVWVHTLVHLVEAVITDATCGEAEKPDKEFELLAGAGAVRVVDGITYIAIAAPTCLRLLRKLPHGYERAAFAYPDGSTCLAADFFDDDELALVLETPAGARSLVTCAYAGFEGDAVVGADELDTAVEPTAELQLARARPLTLAADVALALNGRKGRRVGCVLGDGGRRVEVFDMDEDEAEDGEGEDEDGQAGEEDGEDGDGADVEMG